MLTGYPYGPGSARQIKPTDWPYFGSIVKMLKPSETLPALTSVWLPDVMRLNDNVTPAGQTAGFLGKHVGAGALRRRPGRCRDYHIEGLAPAGDMTPRRVDRRRDLLGQLDRHFDSVERGGRLEAWDRLSQHAFDLVTSGTARAAFDLSKEPDATPRPLRPAHLGAVRAAGPAADRGRRAAGPRQLAARAGRLGGR